MGYYYFNSCSPIFNIDDKGNSLQGIRKGIVVEVFLMYLIFVVCIAIGIKNKQFPYKRPDRSNQKADIKQIPIEQNKQQENDDQSNDKPGTEKNNIVQQNIEYCDVEDWFYSVFGYHTVAVGFALAFSPYAFSIIICYLHFLLYVGCVVIAKFGQKFGLKEKGIFIIYILTGVAQFFNIMIIIAGLGNLGQASAGTVESYKECFLKQIGDIGDVSTESSE